jgi:hypothetical protein
MPYVFDPATWSSIWYPEGSAPPVVDKNAEPGSRIGQNFEPAPSGATPSTAATSSTSTSASTPAQNMEQRNAYEALRVMFDSYGLGSLAPKILSFVQQGYGPDTISLMLQETTEYKQRFAGNETRKKNGLSVLSPAEYLSVERSYRQLLESNGLPKGFYDSQSDFTKWIGDDVAPEEIRDRVNLAVKAVHNTDQNYLKSLREYGLGEGDLVAAMLDRDRALPILQKRVREAEIGAEARRQGLGLSQDRASYFESLGVTAQEAAQAYQTIGQVLTPLENIGKIYGETYGQEDLENELLGRSGAASQKRARLQSKETSAFSGQSAVGQRTLGGKSRGQF